MGMFSWLGDIFEDIFDFVEDVIGEVISWFVDIPDPDDFGNETKGTLLNKSSNIAQIPVIYGQRKVGGTRVFVATSGADNEYLYMVLVLCEGEIEEIGDVYLNDVISTDSKFSGLVTINKYLGTDSQTADSTLIGVNGWSTNHRLRGVAYLACRFKWDQDAFGSMPDITAIVKGRKVYDTRTATTVYSTNPALCLRDYLTNSRYGKGLPTSAIDDTLISSAATKCEEQITPYTGGSAQNIFDCNAVVSTDKTILNNVRVLLSGMRGLMPYSQGKYGLIVEDEGSSVFTFTEDHIVGGISIGGVKKKDKKNRVIVSFVNPDNSWQPDQIEYPKSDSSDYTSYLAEDNGIELDQRLDLKTITDVYQAEDIAEIILKKSRNSISCSFTATSEALQVSVGDIVAVTHSTPAWTAKTFRVVKLSITAEGTVKVDLIEHQDSIYPWSSKTEKDDIPDTTLPDPYTVGLPTNIIATETLYSTRDNGIKAKVDLSWTASDDQFVREYEWGYLKNGDSVYTTGVTRSTSHTIYDIDPAKYTFRVKAINSIGVSSDYATLIQEIAGLLAPPSVLTGVSLQAVSSLAILSWSESSDLDVKNGGKIEVRHSNLLSGATWANSVSIGTALAGTATVAVLPLLSGTYIIRAVDSSGIYSPSATVTTEAATVQAYSTVGTVQAHPNWSGTHDDTVAVDNVLRLQGNSDIDDWASVDAVSNFDLGTTGVDVGGTYTFSAGIDAGSVKRQRLIRDLTMTTVNNASTVDGRTTNIDTWLDFDQTDDLSANAIVYVRTTDDDPTGSPTWGGWEKLEVVEYNHRAFEFKVDVSSPDIDHNIRLSELTITSQEIT